MHSTSIDNTVIVRKLYKGEQIAGRPTVKYVKNIAKGGAVMDEFCRAVYLFCDHFETAMIIALRSSINESLDVLHTALHHLIFKLNTSVQRDVLTCCPENDEPQHDDYMIITIDIIIEYLRSSSQ